MTVVPAPNQTVCVIGNLQIDLIVRGVERLPGWGHEVKGHQHSVASAGQAGSLARGLRAFGVPVTVVANVGQDDAGRQILRDLRSAGVDAQAVEVSLQGPTGVTVAVVRPDGERAFVSDFGSIAEFDEDFVMRHWNQVRRAQLVCLVGLFSLPSLDIAAAKRVIGRARAEGKTTVLDTGWDPDDWRPETIEGVRSLLGEVDIFLPNAEEALALTGERNGIAAAAALVEHGVGLVVIKRGREGSLARRGPMSWEVPALEAKVKDTVGAGDAFNAGFLYGHICGWEAPVAMAFANATASIYVSREEDRFPQTSEVLEAAGAYGTVPGSLQTLRSSSIPSREPRA